jgi:hypothetical protein
MSTRGDAMRYYKPVHFCPEEFLPPEIYSIYGDGGLIAMDARILWTADALWEAIAADTHNTIKIIINDYKWGGNEKQRGYRTDSALLSKAPLSQHRFGRAIDFIISNMSAQLFRANVKAGKYAQALQYVTRIEDGVEWCHLDCASIAGYEIEFFQSQR